MVENTNVIALVAYWLVGLIIGWGVLAIRADIRIQKDNRWRRFRAFFLASICILFGTALLFVTTLGFLLCSAGILVVLVYAMRRRKKQAA
jgi:Ca2+/Na+ antiporter